MKLKRSLIFALILLLTLNVLTIPAVSLAVNNVSVISSSSQTSEVVPIFQKGLSYSAWSSNAFGTPESDESLRLLTQTNTEWIALCFSWVQSNTTSSDIHIDPTGSPTTASVKHAITVAHSLGLKVMLKPMVEPLTRIENRPYPVWRGEIQPSDEWFDSYSGFINYFAEFAQENGVELFCVGCEYKQTTGETEQWRNVIEGVRERYSGPITYAADWTNYYKIEWWDSVDYVGIDAYFPLSIFDSNPTPQWLQNVWNSYADEIEEWLTTINKPVILTEIGYRSGDGTSMAPSNYWSDMTVDLQEQHDCYQAAFQALWNRDWFYGFYWWTWIHDPTKGGPSDSYHTPQNKPTQDLITQWYSKNVQLAVVDQTFTTTTKCNINEPQSVGFHIKWEQDNTDVADAKLYVNGTEYTTNSTGWATLEVTYNTVGKRSWTVTDLQHPQATRYKNTTSDPSIIWDKLIVTVQVDSNTFFASKIKVTIIQAYDKTAVTGATTLVNGQPCEETEKGIYMLELSALSPVEQVVVLVETTDFASQTLTSSTFHVMNTVLYLVILAVLLAILVMFLKRRRNHSNQHNE